LEFPGFPKRIGFIGLNSLGWVWFFHFSHVDWAPPKIGGVWADVSHLSPQGFFSLPRGAFLALLVVHWVVFGGDPPFCDRLGRRGKGPSLGWGPALLGSLRSQPLGVGGPSQFFFTPFFAPPFWGGGFHHRGFYWGSPPPFGVFFGSHNGGGFPFPSPGVSPSLLSLLLPLRGCILCATPPPWGKSGC